MKTIILFFLLLFISFNTKSQNNTLNNNSKSTSLSYGNKGWKVNYNNQFEMNLEWRFQLRSEFNSNDSYFFIEEPTNNKGSFNIRRARLKVGGFAYKPYMKYYFEYDMPSNSLLNLQFNFGKLKWLQFKLGQWKIKYNSERYISSGKQQLAERTISNKYFTLDRQIGIMLHGDLFDGKLISSSYNIGIFNGNGRMNENNNGKFLFFARYQWNFSRKPIKMSFCDLKRTKKIKGFMAIAYTWNESAFTRFSTSGGGQIPGYVETGITRYTINQYNIESMLKYKGFSLSNEYHLKSIYDNELKQESNLVGGYIMAGYFFNEIISFIPKPLEIITRYSQVNNNTLFQNNTTEYTFGLNWFFTNHRNKITIDLSYLENIDFIKDKDNYRIRIQWDVSF